ncbi:response regulator transcription factor [Pedobacter boryungensis]|uniref:Response regulator transcription factor n=1 Tax=Pedobacter boryungensis TaxID=869962 RepID=A0ABX2DGB9_9SPHI|nr:response regulator transcription factor [Pedobacter boryungensis]NQX33153.1 response regulator transcription factor [Pedobacter boryungensis]
MEQKLVIFEDNEALRNSLVYLLNSHTDYVVVADFNNVVDVKKQVSQYKPDLVIMDIDMPGKDGISGVEDIKEVRPQTTIIMYTQFEDDERLFKSICAGADGYILKKTSPEKLFDAITEVLNGGAPMSPMIAKKVISSFKTSRQKDSIQIKYDLTKREAEILQLLTKGYSVKLIAHEMNIAYDTARSHLRNTYRKLQVNCGKEAIAILLASKII